MTPKKPSAAVREKAAPGSQGPGNGYNRLKLAGSILAGLIMLVLVLQHSYAAYLLEANPELLIKLRPAHADGLIKLATDRLDQLARLSGVSSRLEGLARLPRPEEQQLQTFEGTAAGDATAAAEQDAKQFAHEHQSLRDQSIAALRLQPLSAQAMFILGVLAAREGDVENVHRFMAAVVARSRRNRVALYSVLHRSFETREYDRAITFADALARLDAGRNMPLVAPILWRMAETEAAMPFVVAALEGAPPWRTALFQSVRGNIRDARTPLSIFLRLKASGKAPDLLELSSYLGLLIENKLYSVARNTWLQGLDSERLSVAGFLYDGGFAFEPSRLPFEWQMASDRRLIQQRAPREGDPGNLMLRIDFPGVRTDPTVLSQLLLLMPGNFVLSGLFSGQIRARRGMTWVVECAETGKRIAASTLITGNVKGWTGFQLPVSVPAEDCKAQWLRLRIEARSPSETMLTGSLAFDDLVIKRLVDMPKSDL